MSIKGKKFTDDGWAIWIDGDDTSTIYFHDWMSPKGKSYIDVSVKIVGIKGTSKLCLYVPFEVSAEEIEDISLAYDEYYHGQVSTERADALKYINEEALTEHSFFDRYYGKYLSMQPTEDKIQVYASLTNSNRTLKITVKNNNSLPLQSCTVKYDFRLLYVPTASYADNEYENGSETYMLEDIGGNESKVFEFDFNVDKYYDGYYSYHFATLWESSIDIISFK